MRRVRDACAEQGAWSAGLEALRGWCAGLDGSGNGCEGTRRGLRGAAPRARWRTGRRRVAAGCARLGRAPRVCDCVGGRTGARWIPNCRGELRDGGRPCGVVANAAVTCAAGSCGFLCNLGSSNCDGDSENGCEVAVASRRAEVGGRCPSGVMRVLRAGRRMCCCGSQHDCDGIVNGGAVNSDARSGSPVAVWESCASGQPMRSACPRGTCGIACVAGFGNCDGITVNGCEVDVRLSSEHCGAWWLAELVSGALMAYATAPFASTGRQWLTFTRTRTCPSSRTVPSDATIPDARHRDRRGVVLLISVCAPVDARGGNGRTAAWTGTEVDFCAGGDTGNPNGRAMTMRGGGGGGGGLPGWRACIHSQGGAGRAGGCGRARSIWRGAGGVGGGYAGGGGGDFNSVAITVGRGGGGVRGGGRLGMGRRWGRVEVSRWTTARRTVSDVRL